MNSRRIIVFLSYTFQMSSTFFIDKIYILFQILINVSFFFYLNWYTKWEFCSFFSIIILRLNRIHRDNGETVVSSTLAWLFQTPIIDTNRYVEINGCLLPAWSIKQADLVATKFIIVAIYPSTVKLIITTEIMLSLGQL